MLVIMEKHPEIIKLAKDAIQSVGLSPISRPIRGGTDGAQLSFKGLPCPNLGTGGYGFHGPYEHVSLEGMETVVQELIYIGSNPIQ
jgi:tripeptide aminopeptidase